MPGAFWNVNLPHTGSVLRAITKSFNEKYPNVRVREVPIPAAGYADQAHFTREVRAFMGNSPGGVAGRVGKIQDAHAYAREY